MAIIEGGGLLSEFKGRFGNAVIYKLNGKTVMRTLPFGNGKKAQGKRKQYQQDFSWVMKHMQRVKPFISHGFFHVAEGRSPFHTALSVNLKRYREAGMPVSPEWLLLSQGNLAGVNDLALDKPENETVVLRWGDPEAETVSAADDVAMVLALNSRTLNSTRETSTVNRSAGQLTMQLPEIKKGDEVHFFITFRNLFHPTYRKNPNEISTSQWVGKVVI